MTGNKTKHVLLHLIPQASGPPLPPVALGHLLAVTSPSLPLMTTRQCSLEETNQDVAVESMNVIFWIFCQWYAQRNCDNYLNYGITGRDRIVQVLSNEGHYIVKQNYKYHLPNHGCVFVYCIGYTNHSCLH